MEYELKLENNIVKDDKACKTSRVRHVLSHVVDKTVVISSIDLHEEEGDIVFSVSAKDLGLSQKFLYTYHHEIYSNFVADIVGELIVRDNMELFIDALSKMNTTNYISAVSRDAHKHFGMKYEKGYFVFSFHVSLIQKIITESFKAKV